MTADVQSSRPAEDRRSRSSVVVQACAGALALGLSGAFAVGLTSDDTGSQAQAVGIPTSHHGSAAPGAAGTGAAGTGAAGTDGDGGHVSAASGGDGDATGEPGAGGHGADGHGAADGSGRVVHDHGDLEVTVVLLEGGAVVDGTVGPGSLVTAVNRTDEVQSLTSDDGVAFDVEAPLVRLTTFRAPQEPGSYDFASTSDAGIAGTLVVR